MRLMDVAVWRRAARSRRRSQSGVAMDDKLRHRRPRVTPRTTAVALITALAAALWVPTPVAARPAKACPRFKPAVPSSDSARPEEARSAPVVTVDDRATEDEPVRVTFQQGPAAWTFVSTGGGGVGLEDFHWVNAQVVTRRRGAGLHIRLSWATLSPDEFDLRVYGGSGELLALSDHVNVLPPGETPFAEGEGGNGFEYVAGILAGRCQGFTIESAAFWTPGREMTLELWLGDIHVGG